MADPHSDGRTETDGPLERAARLIEGIVELPSGFLLEILFKDDWDCILKLSALIETALGDWLSRALGAPALEDDIGKLPFRTKLTWVLKLNGLFSQDGAFIEALMSLRNRLAHNIRGIPAFSIGAYIDEKGEATGKALLMDTITGLTPVALPGDALYYRAAIWRRAMLIMLALEAADRARQERARDEFIQAVEAEQALHREALQQVLQQELQGPTEPKKDKDAT